MIENKIRVLIVDDTAFYRMILKNVLSDFSEIDIIGSAPNGKIALQKIEQLSPDLITLDVEMPEMNGIETLKELKKRNSKTNSIMVSAHTKKDAKITMEALELGAFDFIAKPDSSKIEDNTENLKKQFKPILNALFTRNALRGIEKESPVLGKPAPQISPIKTSAKPDIVAIGISTGGPKALAEVIPKLPENLQTPIVIVQHMPPVFTKALADSLNNKSKLSVHEGTSDQKIEKGNVYIAPGGKQMKVVTILSSASPVLKITDDPPENHCKPAADYLFRSVAQVYQNKSLGVIMTGMGNDGTMGLRLMKRQGAQVIAQNKETCIVFGMPLEAIKANVVDDVLPLNRIAINIEKIVKG